jgi:hypothetical protein
MTLFKMAVYDQIEPSWSQSEVVQNWTRDSNSDFAPGFCSFAHIPRIFQSSSQKNIVAIPFPAGTTNGFQALDLVLFRVLEKLKAIGVGECDAQITKRVQTDEQTGDH